MSDTLLKLLDSLPDRILKIANQHGGIGLNLGILISREILERQGEEEAAQLVHYQPVIALLKKVASGDLIMQDQLIMGISFDPLVEQKFQEIAQTFLEQVQ